MGTDPKAEILTRIARRKELIETSKKRIEKLDFLSEQSHRLIRIAMRRDVDGEGANHKTDVPDSIEGAEHEPENVVFTSCLQPALEDRPACIPPESTAYQQSGSH